MSDGWREMDSAPKDGTWVLGRDAVHGEAVIQFRNPMADVPGLEDMGNWFAGEPVKEGNWEKNVCFYPTGWKPLEGKS